MVGAAASASTRALRKRSVATVASTIKAESGARAARKRTVASVVSTIKAESGTGAARSDVTSASAATTKAQSANPSPIEDSPKLIDVAAASKLSEKKFNDYSPYVTQSPFPEFGRPTVAECWLAHEALAKLHQDAVNAELTSEDMPETIPHALDALIVAVMSQATSWSNAKRAMASMTKTYGSVFAYDAILDGGSDKLEQTIRCGGLHVRKTKIIMTILEDVKKRYGKWDLDHLHSLSDEEAMQELLSYKYIGTKSASVVMSWSLKRTPFTVDTHVYRIAGLWGWRPESASKEKCQSHLEYMIPAEMRKNLHFLMIQHGRACPVCRGGAKGKVGCEVLKAISKVKG